jgi:hypothetical protein
MPAIILSVCGGFWFDDQQGFQGDAVMKFATDFVELHAIVQNDIIARTENTV